MKAGRIATGTLAMLAASPSLAWAEEGGGGGLFDINLGLSVWTLIVFAVLLFLLGKFAWGPILAAVDAREKSIQTAIDGAAEQNAEAARLLEEHRVQLAEARRQANDLIAEGKAAGEAVREDIKEKARAEAREILERARSEIEAERDAALETLRKESVELALAAASRLLAEKIDGARDRDLVERYLGGIGADAGSRA